MYVRAWSVLLNNITCLVCVYKNLKINSDCQLQLLTVENNFQTHVVWFRKKETVSIEFMFMYQTITRYLDMRSSEFDPVFF